jgi:hypothetical protein
MARFLAEVKRCNCHFEMMAATVCNNNKTHTYGNIYGTVFIKGQTSEKGMRLGKLWEIFGSLLAIVGVDGRVWWTVCIFAVAAKKPTQQLS